MTRDVALVRTLTLPRLDASAFSMAEAAVSALLNHTGSARSGFAASIVTILGGQIVNVAIALLTEVCIARLLGPAPRGLVSMCMMAIWFAATVGGLGGDIPIVIWAAGRKKPSDWLGTLLWWALAGSFGVEFVWWFLYSRLHTSLLLGVTPALAEVVLLCIPLAILFNYLIAHFTGGERFAARAAVALSENAASLIGLLLLVWLYGRSADSAMWGNCFGLAVGVGVAVLLLFKKVYGADRYSTAASHTEVRSGLLIGLRGQLGNVAAIFTYRLDVFIVNYFLNAAQVGIYAVGVVVSESLWHFPQAVATALFPRTARTAQQDAAAFTCLILRQVFLISCISGAILAVAAPIAIPLFFGTRFASAVPVIWWLLPGTVALATGKVAASDLAGRGKTTYSSAFSVIALIVTVILDLALIPRMGIRGAALASSAAYLVNSVLLLSATRHELKVSWSTLLVPRSAELWHYKQAAADLLSRRSLVRSTL